MNKLKLFLLAALLSPTLSHASNSEKDFNSFSASKMASSFARLKTPEDLYKYFSFSKNDHDLIEKDISSGVFKGFTPLKVYMPDGVTLQVSHGQTTAELKFSQFHQGHLYVNGKKIQLDKKKNYFNYRQEIEFNSKPPKTSFLYEALVTEAHADAIDWMKSVIGAAISSSGTNHMWGMAPKFVLEETLIETYRNEAASWKQINRKKGWSHFFADTFTCSGNQLDQINESVLVFDGRPRHQDKSSTKLIRKADGSFERHTECGVITTDTEGKINNLSGYKCRRKATSDQLGDSLSGVAPFFSFYKTAQQCCAKQGCYEKVSAALEEMKKDFLIPEAKVPAKPAAK